MLINTCMLVKYMRVNNEHCHALGSGVRPPRAPCCSTAHTVKLFTTDTCGQARDESVSAPERLSQPIAAGCWQWINTPDPPPSSGVRPWGVLLSLGVPPRDGRAPLPTMDTSWMACPVLTLDLCCLASPPPSQSFPASPCN